MNKCLRCKKETKLLDLFWAKKGLCIKCSNILSKKANKQYSINARQEEQDELLRLKHKYQRIEKGTADTYELVNF